MYTGPGVVVTSAQPKPAAIAATRKTPTVWTMTSSMVSRESVDVIVTSYGDPGSTVWKPAPRHAGFDERAAVRGICGTLLRELTYERQYEALVLGLNARVPSLRSRSRRAPAARARRSPRRRPRSAPAAAALRRSTPPPRP